MRRRDFLKTVPAATALSLALPKLVGAARFKITDVRLSKVRLIKDMGVVPRYAGGRAGLGLPIQIGGFTFTEVVTDQGLVGIGPGIDPSVLRNVKNILVGKDPFDINAHATSLYAPNRNWGGPVEIALWDLLGKATDLPVSIVRPHAALVPGSGRGH